MALLRTLPESVLEAAPAAPRARRRRRRLPFSGWHLLLLPTALVFVVPLVSMVLTSVMPDTDINRYPPRFLPSRLTIAGYAGLFEQSDVLRWLLNTVIVASCAVGAHLVLCSLAGYGFARLKFPGVRVGFFAILATIMIPTQLLMIPTYLLFSRLGLVNTLGSAIVPWLTSAFGIFLMRQFFLSMPRELEESARVEGCNQLQVLLHIVLPLARPALATLSIFTLLGSWNDLIWPLVSINNEHWFTLQLGLANFQGTRRTQWSLLMSGNVVATLPLIGFFLAAQRQFIATMTFSGIKG